MAYADKRDGKLTGSFVGERRKIGRDLIERETGATVRVVSVDVVALWAAPTPTSSRSATPRPNTKRSTPLAATPATN